MVWWVVRLLSIIGTLGALFGASKLLSATIDDYYFQGILLPVGIYIILAVSLNLINGITGQFSIGHAGFYAIGAYVGASWTMLAQPALVHSQPWLRMGAPAGDALNLLIAILLAMAAAGLAGFVVGLPSLRLRGDYLAIVTLGFGEVIRVLLLNIEAVGGARGLSGIPTLVLSNNLAVFWIFLFVVLVVAVSRNLMQSVRGLTWLAVREDEIAADAMGVNTTGVKVTAFVIGSAFAGAAGALHAHFIYTITPDLFGIDTSIVITTMVVLGGSGSVTGAIMAAALLTSLPEILRNTFPKSELGEFIKHYRMVIYSALLVVMMLTRPQGILGHAELGFGLFRRRRRSTKREGAAA